MTNKKLTDQERDGLVSYMREHRNSHPSNRAVFAAGIEALSLGSKLKPQNSNCARYMRMAKNQTPYKRQQQQKPQSATVSAPAPMDGMHNGHSLVAQHSVESMKLDHCPNCNARFYIAKGGD